jgi:hypothetical protein
MVLPIWVPGEAAAHLRSLLGVKPSCTVLLNVEELEAVKAYVRRAECEPLQDAVFVSTTGVSGGGPAEVFESVLRGYDRAGHYPDLRVLENLLRESFAQRYVIVRPPHVSQRVVSYIRERLPEAHVVVVAGDAARTVAGALTGSTVVEPEADAATLRQGRQFMFEVSQIMEE